MTAALLTCRDPLRPRRAEPHFAATAATARELGAAVALIDHDAAVRGDTEAAVAAVPPGLGPTWYRGWMLPSTGYTALVAALAERGCRLLTDAEHYRRAHELPGWYETFAAVTPRSAWLATEPGRSPSAEHLAELAAQLRPGAAIVKDYVKSRKHEWDEACFIPDLDDPQQLATVVGRFAELQGDFLAGGIVLRAFENLIGAEARVWWIDGEPALTTAHPDAADADPPTVGTGVVAPLVRALDCRFVTTDLALRDDKVWRVVEVGDGQVSDLPATTDPRLLLEPLLRNVS